MTQTPANLTQIEIWKEAVGRASEAEMLLRAAFDDYAKGFGPPPTVIQIGEAKLLRRLASEALKAAMLSTTRRAPTDAGQSN